MILKVELDDFFFSLVSILSYIYYNSKELDFNKKS